MLKECLAGIILVGASVPSMVSAEKKIEPAECFAGRMTAMKDGNFSGPFICGDKYSSFRLTGSARNFVVYNYSYRFLPENGAVLHGGQRILIFDSAGKYLGQYALSPPPVMKITIDDSYIKIYDGEKIKGVIDLSAGPPVDVNIDGENGSFFK